MRFQIKRQSTACLLAALLALASMGRQNAASAQSETSPTASMSEGTGQPIDMTEAPAESPAPEFVEMLDSTKVDSRNQSFESLPPTPLSTSLYSFEEEEGLVASDGLGEVDGRLEGGATRDLGFLDNALSLDGIDQYAAAGFPQFAEKDFTIAAWIKPRSVVVDSWRSIVAKERAFTTANRFRLYLGGNNRLGFVMSDARGRGGVALETLDNAAPVNQWTHVAITRAGTCFSLYVNGELALREMVNKTISHENDLELRIGASHSRTLGQDAFRCFDGLIDEVLVQEGALSAEVLALRLIDETRDAWLKVGDWSRVSVKMYWRRLVWNIEAFAPQAGRYELCFHHLSGSGFLEVDQLGLRGHGVDSIEMRPLGHSSFLWRFNLVKPEDTLLLSATVRMLRRNDSQGELLIRRLPDEIPY